MKGFRQRLFSTSDKKSTLIVVDIKWEISCVLWRGREINPVQISVQQLADIYDIKYLVPPTIKDSGHRYYYFF